MTIQLASAEDVFLWPCGTHCTRDEFERGGFQHLSDDFEVAAFGTPRHEEITRDHSASLDTSEREAR